MFFKTTTPGLRAELKIATIGEASFPKGKRSTDIQVTIDGNTETLRVTNNVPFALNPVRYGYFVSTAKIAPIDGKVFWMAFDPGFDFSTPIEFTSSEGETAIANPPKEPAKPHVEAARIAKFKATYAARHAA